MGFNYFFNYFIKRFISLFVRKFFYIILIIFITALIFFVGSYIGLNKSKAVTTEEAQDILNLKDELCTRINNDYGVDISNTLGVIFMDYNTMTYTVFTTADIGRTGIDWDGFYFLTWINYTQVTLYRYSFVFTTSTENNITTAIPHITGIYDRLQATYSGTRKLNEFTRYEMFY